jgi:hypothetical protein
MCAALLLGAGPLCAAPEKPISAARLLDEVIVRPGDFDQMCDAPPPVPFAAPPIPAFGLSVAQDLFLSDEMKEKVRVRRPEIIKEMEARFEKFDWLKPPPAPPISKKPLFVKKEPGNEEFDATKPSGQNPRAMGGIMLTIIGDLEAVELLPELLKLEDSLHQITQTALADPKAPVPDIEIGGGAMWKGMEEEFSKVEDWDKAPPELKRKEKLFHALVFDRQMLGMMLQLLQHKNYRPLADSTPGLLRVMAIKRKPLDEEMAKIKRPEDIPENERRYITFDKELNVPVWRYEHAEVLYSEPMREEVRGLVQAFVSGTMPPTPNGQDLMTAALRSPGGFSQMCAMPLPLPFDAPVPAYGVLAPRNFHFDNRNRQVLQAHRAKVIPVLIDKLRAIDLKKVPAKKSTGPAPYSLLLEVVRTEHAIEALPELLHLEEQLHAAMAAAAQDEKKVLPPIDLDSPVVWQNEGKADVGDRPRKNAEFEHRVLQREVLGLIGKLLRDENYEPYFATTLDKGYAEGMQKLVKEGELKDIKMAEDIPYESRELIHWDNRLGVPVSVSAPPIKVPYTEALRDEVRKSAEEFLKSVPPEQRKGEAAMQLVVKAE